MISPNLSIQVERIQKFLKDCNITEKELKNLWYNVNDLYLIYKDFKNKTLEYKELWSYIVQSFLQRSELFHSIKFRVKTPEWLINKIIRKGKKWISVDNYFDHIKDLLWIRILLLDKTDWQDIHKFIDKKRKVEKRESYYYDENEKNSYEKIFKKNEIKRSIVWYNSIHYTIITHPTKQEVFVEIQVRSLLEEVRWEVDHLLRYKKSINKYEKPVITNWLHLLNSLVRDGNDLVSLLCEINKNESYIKDLSKIRTLIQESSLDNEEKDKLYNQIRPFYNLGIYITEDIPEGLWGLIKSDEKLKKTLLPIIEKLTTQQKEIRKKLEKIEKIQWLEYNK